jgi:hypothetical protein
MIRERAPRLGILAEQRGQIDAHVLGGKLLIELGDGRADLFGVRA